MKHIPLQCLVIVAATLLGSGLATAVLAQPLPMTPQQAAGEAGRPQPNPPSEQPASGQPVPGRPGKPGTAAAPKGPWPFFPLAAAWTVDLGASPAAPAAFAGGLGFIPLQSGQLTALDVSSGAVVWTRPAATRVGLVTDGGRLFVVGDGEIEAVNVKDGASLWRVPIAGTVVKRPAARGGWLIAGLESGEVIALRAEDGKTMWTLAVGGPVTIDPLIEGDRLYLASPTRGLLACDLVTGRVLWERRVDGAISAVLAVPDAVYVGTAGRWFYAVNEGSGKVSWHWRVAGEPIGIGVEDRVVVTLLLDHTIRAFRTGNGAQAWRETLIYRPFAGPIGAPGQWLVAGHQALVRAYTKDEGQQRGVYQLPFGRSPDSAQEQIETLAAAPHVHMTPSIFDDALVLITQRGIVHAARRQTVPALPVLTTVTPLPGTAVPNPTLPRGVTLPPPPSATPPL